MRPPLYSPAFHLHYLPMAVIAQLKGDRAGPVTFGSTTGLHLLLTAAVIALVLGLPGALAGSYLGWGALCAGTVGLLALSVHAVVTRRGRPGFDGFLPGPFFFCVVLGVSAGIFSGALEHSLARGLIVGGPGILVGYMAGIAAGLAVQYLGWLAPVVSGLAWLALFGVGMVDLVLLSGLF